MADEGTFDFALTVSKIPPMVSAEGLNIAGYNFNVSSGIFSKGVLLVSHSAQTAIPLGQVSSPGFAIFINMDSVRTITIYNGNGGTSVSKIAELGPGDPAGDPSIIKLPTSCVPYAQSSGAADSNLLFCIFST